VPRQRATDADDEKVERLVSVLLGDLDRVEASETVASVAREADLGHETVRRLLRNPGGRLRSGPSFFVVAAIARARQISLDRLASAVLDRPDLAAESPAGRDSTNDDGGAVGRAGLRG